MVVNKLDRIPDDARDKVLDRIERRVRERNPDVHVVGATAGRIDPALLYDVSGSGEAGGQLSLRELLVDTAEDETHEHPHVHADSVTVTSDGCVEPGALIDLLEQPPAGVYRLKGTVAVRYRDRTRRYVVNVVGTSVHLANAKSSPANALVAIGTRLDVDDVRERLEAALAPYGGRASAAGVRRLQRYRRLSI